MTREEAIFCEKSYLGETNCIDCKHYGTDTCKSRESHRMAIKALEQEPVIDKIRAEIEQLPTSYVEIFTRHSGVKYRDTVELGAVTRIFDKYKAESEGKE